MRRFIKVFIDQSGYKGQTRRKHRVLSPDPLKLFLLDVQDEIQGKRNFERAKLQQLALKYSKMENRVVTSRQLERIVRRKKDQFLSKVPRMSIGFLLN